MVADHSSFTDDDAGAVVDKEIFADCRAGMDVDAGFLVRQLSHDARNERYLQFI